MLRTIIGAILFVLLIIPAIPIAFCIGSWYMGKALAETIRDEFV